MSSPKLEMRVVRFSERMVFSAMKKDHPPMAHFIEGEERRAREEEAAIVAWSLSVCRIYNYNDALFSLSVSCRFALCTDCTVSIVTIQ